MVVHMNDGTITAFNFREKAPRKASEIMFVNEEGEYADGLNHEGYLAVGVPGTVAGFDLALERLGTMSWKALTQPAVDLAEDGFPLSWSMARAFRALDKSFKRYPASARKFFRRDGTFYQPGDTWKQPDLARTLARIRDDGKNGFYRGETARLLAADMAKNGGLITEQDLAEYEAQERDPVQGTYRKYDVISMSPPSSGGTALIEMLNILEAYDLSSVGHNSARYMHLLAESMRIAYADRARYLGDPDHNRDMPIEMLLSKEYAADRRMSIQDSMAGVSEPSDILPFESEQTTHYSVVDKWGNAVVVTYTLEYGYGSRIVADGLGFLLNNEMGDFNPVPGLTDTLGKIGTPPNRVAPGKRMLSSMTPTILAKDGKPVALLGTLGGRTIISQVLQIALNIVDFDMNIAEAVSARRMHHQWLPDVLIMERWSTSEDSKRLLQSMGHSLREIRYRGGAMAISIDHDEGIFWGATDPRSADASAVGY